MSKFPTPVCALCKQELEELGAILLSPPVEDGVGIAQVDKYHVCARCWHGSITHLIGYN